MKSTNKWNTFVSCITTVRLPQHMVPALCSGDRSALSEEEDQQLQAWIKDNKPSLGHLTFELGMEREFDIYPSIGLPGPTVEVEVFHIVRWEVMCHGANHNQYRSYAYSGRDDQGDFIHISALVWGHGDNDAEAYEDALRNLADITGNGEDPAYFMPDKLKGIKKSNALTREERQHPEWDRVVSIAIH